MNLKHLDKIAKKYDLSDADDRANFRGEVKEAHKPTKMAAINEWLGTNHKNREEAVRALADKYIAQNQSSNF